MVAPNRPGPVRKGSESPNAAPLPNARFTVTSDERVITTFTTDADGRFEVSLKPGRYSVLLTENRFPKPCGFTRSQSRGRQNDELWNGAVTQECGEKLLAKNFVSAERGIRRLPTQCCLTSQRLLPKSIQRITNASLRVFCFFARKVLTVGDSKLLTKNKLIWGESLRGSIFAPRRDRA